jgi:Holliday junction resolvasome RuvABC DNA-binding subunit
MAANLGPLVAMKGTLKKSHAGVSWPLESTQLLLERESPEEIFVIEFSSERKVRYLERLQGPLWIYIAQVIREDALSYFGFSSLSERCLFEEIKEIKDVGPRTAATLVAELDAVDFLRLMNEGAWKGLKIAGVGPKTLESLVFGLNKRKKSLLPLLDQARREASPLEDLELSQNSPDPKSKKSESPTHAEVAPQGWRPNLYASEALVKMFEGLGLQAAQTHSLFDDCFKNVAGFRDLSDQQRVPVMLQRWGQARFAQEGSLL